MRPAKNIVDQLQAEGLLEKIEPHDHNVGVRYRCHTTVVPHHLQAVVRQDGSSG